MKQSTIFSNLLAGNFDNIGKILESFLSQWWGPIIGVVAASAAILGIVVGVKWILASQSGDEQKIKQAKNAVIGVIIGIVVMFIITALVPVIVAAFQSWYDNDAQEYLTLIVNVI